MSKIDAALKEARLPFREYGVTAVDAYRGGSRLSPPGFYLVQGSIVDLARIFENLSFPSLPYADAAIQGSGEEPLSLIHISEPTRPY